MAKYDSLLGLRLLAKRGTGRTPSSRAPAAQPQPPGVLTRTPPSLDELVGLELEAGARDVARRMLDHGASSALVRRVLGEVLRRGARGAFAVDAALDVLGRSLPILPSPKRPKSHEKPPLFACVGPAGAGKTTSLVKLGRKLEEAGRRVVYASLDPLSLPGADALLRVGSLESDIDRGEVPLQLVRGPDDLRRLLRRPAAARGAGAVDAVLLDTPGLSPRETERLDELARMVARSATPCELQTLLVLSAASSRGALELATSAFQRFQPDGAVLTKLDETDEPGAAYEALLSARLPVAFLCDGQDARAHLVRPTPGALADLVLRGEARDALVTKMAQGLQRVSCDSARELGRRFAVAGAAAVALLALLCDAPVWLASALGAGALFSLRIGARLGVAALESSLGRDRRASGEQAARSPR